MALEEDDAPVAELASEEKCRFLGDLVALDQLCSRLAVPLSVVDQLMDTLGIESDPSVELPALLRVRYSLRRALSCERAQRAEPQRAEARTTRSGPNSLRAVGPCPAPCLPGAGGTAPAHRPPHARMLRRRVVISLKPPAAEKKKGGKKKAAASAAAASASAPGPDNEDGEWGKLKRAVQHAMTVRRLVVPPEAKDFWELQGVTAQDLWPVHDTETDTDSTLGDVRCVLGGGVTERC